MTSSTKPSDSSPASRPNPRLTLAAVGIAFAAMLLGHAVLEPLASWAESERDAYLWSTEEWLTLFTPANHAGRGDGRLLLLGPSESREGFIPAHFDAALPDLAAYQNSQSMGTLEDTLVLLDYIEREYGESAMPDAMLVGLAPRYVSSMRSTGVSPLFKAIDLYGPRLEMDHTGPRPALRERSALSGLRARVSHRFRQQRRYRSALLVVARDILLALDSPYANHRRLVGALTASKYHSSTPWRRQDVVAWLNTKGAIWDRVHNWDAKADSERVLRDFGDLKAFAERHDIDLYAVNLPEISISRGLYPPGYYEAYFALIHEGLAGVPLLDLRLMLPDDEFYDSCHPVYSSCGKLSDRIATWMAGVRAERGERGR